MSRRGVEAERNCSQWIKCNLHIHWGEWQVKCNAVQKVAIRKLQEHPVLKRSCQEKVSFYYFDFWLIVTFPNPSQHLPLTLINMLCGPCPYHLLQPVISPLCPSLFNIYTFILLLICLISCLNIRHTLEGEGDGRSHAELRACAHVLFAEEIP